MLGAMRLAVNPGLEPLPLAQRAAAVDGEGPAGDVAAGKQIVDKVANLFFAWGDFHQRFIQRLLTIGFVVTLIKHNQRRGDGVDLDLRRQLAGEGAGHIVQRGFAGGVGDMFIAAALHDVIGNMDNITGGMAVAAQQILQRVVEQIGGMDVDLHHAVDHCAQRYPRLLRHPVAGVVDDGAQAAGVRFDRFGEGQYAVIAAEIGLQTEGARVAQAIDRRIGRAIADDDRLVLQQKMVLQQVNLTWQNVQKQQT